MSSFLYSNAMADHSFHMWSKYGIKKSHSVFIIHYDSTVQISNFQSDTGSFHSKGQIRQIASFFCTQKPIFEKVRKTEIKREKRRKTCVFRGASFLYALRGGAEGNRTRQLRHLPSPRNAQQQNIAFQGINSYYIQNIARVYLHVVPDRCVPLWVHIRSRRHNPLDRQTS